MNRAIDRSPTTMITGTQGRRLTVSLARVPALAAFLGLATLAWIPIGCGSSKPTADGATSGSGGGSGAGKDGSGSGTGGGNGSGGFSFDAGGFDLNLDAFSLDGFNLDGFDPGDLKIDGFNVTACPAGVKTGDPCTAPTQSCVAAGKVCGCYVGTWICVGN